ncbi:MAG: metal ABC transporter solute-binding protein, Zn/Mn family [Pseudonocardia sp.]
MSIRHRGTAVTALAVLTLLGCSSRDTAAPGNDEPLTVVASTNVYGSIAEAVGGARITVESLVIDPAADPHSYEATPTDAVAVADASVVVFNGGGYDDWMGQLIESAGGDRTVIDVAELSGLEPTTEPGAGAGGFNEHLWYSLPTVRKLATELAGDLGTADPANATEYAANAEKFTGQVDELLGTAQAIGATHPGTRVAITEPVPGYLIEAAGLTDATPAEFAEAIEEDTDPPAAVLAETLQLFAGDPVRALILNAQTQTPTTDQVRQAAQAAGVPVVEMTETLPEATTDYVSWMGGQIDALAAALNRT